MPTALIVDDEPEANKLLSMLVQLRGYQTHSALTGAEAIALARQERPDVVFLDLMLPDIHGLDVCRALKSQARTSLIPIVVITARLADRNRADSYEAGANDFVPKPYTPDQIFQALSGARAWSKQAAGRSQVGQIPLDDDENRFLHQSSKLRSLVVGHAPDGEQVASIVDSTLQIVRGVVQASGQPHPTAVVEYHLEPDGLTLAVSDQPGWLEGWGRPLLEEDLRRTWNESYDAVRHDEDGRRLVWIKRFRERASDTSR